MASQRAYIHVTMPTIRHCLILEFGRGAYNQAVAPGITRPLHATNQELFFPVKEQRLYFWTLSSKTQTQSVCCSVSNGSIYSTILKCFWKLYNLRNFLFSQKMPSQNWMTRWQLNQETQLLMFKTSTLAMYEYSRYYTNTEGKNPVINNTVGCASFSMASANSCDP